VDKIFKKESCLAKSEGTYWKVPAIPLANTHDKCVRGLIELIQCCNCLYDVVVLPSSRNQSDTVRKPNVRGFGNETNLLTLNLTLLRL